MPAEHTSVIFTNTTSSSSSQPFDIFGLLLIVGLIVIVLLIAVILLLLALLRNRKSQIGHSSEDETHKSIPQSSPISATCTEFASQVYSNSDFQFDGTEVQNIVVNRMRLDTEMMYEPYEDAETTKGVTSTSGNVDIPGHHNGTSNGENLWSDDSDDDDDQNIALKSQEIILNEIKVGSNGTADY